MGSAGHGNIEMQLRDIARQWDSAHARHEAAYSTWDRIRLVVSLLIIYGAPLLGIGGLIFASFYLTPIVWQRIAFVAILTPFLVLVTTNLGIHFWGLTLHSSRGNHEYECKYRAQSDFDDTFPSGSDERIAALYILFREIREEEWRSSNALRWLRICLTDEWTTIRRDRFFS